MNADDLDRKFLAEAIALAREAMPLNLGGPFGALVVLNGQVVGRGVNRVIATNDPTAHAEMNAIREACRNLGRFSLEGATVYTSCEPCPMCLGAIYWSRIGRVVYAAGREDAARAEFDDSLIYRELDLSPQHRKVKFEQLLPEAGNRLFDEWLLKSDRVRY